MKNLRLSRILSMALSLVMLLTITPLAFADDVKWTEEMMADGWIKVTQDGGATLGYSPNSGVKIITVDGYAFKDMNRNGTLDVYEDWREDAQTRAENLTSLLDIRENQVPLMLVQGYDLGYKAGELSEELISVIDSGIRGTCTPFAFKSVADTVEYSNSQQAYAESKDFAIPVNMHAEVGGLGVATSWVNNLSFAATFDPEVVFEYAKSLSSEYRALGITDSMTPQIDLATDPRWSRITTTWTEDPQLAIDLTGAFIDGWQSTFDEEGNNIGWGSQSIIATLKHYPGDGVGESGRESHNFYGAYAVYPGDNLYTQLLPFQSGLDHGAMSVMPSYSIGIDEDGDAIGDEKVASAYDSYKLTDILRDELGFEGVIFSDFIVVSEIKGYQPRAWGVQNLTEVERYLKAILAGMDQFGSDIFVEKIQAAYDLGVEKYGEEFMNKRINESAIRILKNEFLVGLFENPYLEKKESKKQVATDEATEKMYDVQTKAIVMLKNSDNIIHENDGKAEKPTIYVPMTYSQTSGWTIPFDTKTLFGYFDIVTDKIADTLTGEVDKNGNPTQSEADIVRATSDELAACDFALVRMRSPSNVGGGYDAENARYIPLSLQYGEYTANNSSVRTTSLGGDEIEVTIDSPYGAQTVYETENRSYFGNSAVISNSTDLEAVLYAAENVDKVIVDLTLSNPTVMSEFEDKVDAILVDFGESGEMVTKAICEIILGNIEPSALLPLQMPANMETVEAQYEDVPRDMECYTDSEGNTYDFAFGMNWSGVINDERVETYSVEPLEG